MIKELKELFSEDLVFIEEAENSDDIFHKVGKKLLKMGLVKESFIDAVIGREKEFPTGLDLSVVDKDAEIPNVAIPHTESEHCNSKKVVVVKLKNEIAFNNMISPENQLKVKFLFMILNNEKGEQCNILANLMDFFTKVENVSKLSKIEDAKDIYNYIVA